MIKKTLLLAALVAFTATGAIAADTTSTTPTKQVSQQAESTLPSTPQAREGRPELDVPPPPPCKNAKAKSAEFEKRLKLTDEQKEQAKQLRAKSHEQMEPIFKQIKELKQEKEMVTRSRIAVEMQKEKIAVIDAKIKDLKKQAHELRMQNMKDFEAILTDKQKKTLEKMKQEGRKEFAKKHKAKKIGGFDGRPMPPHHPAMQPLGTPAPQTK